MSGTADPSSLARRRISLPAAEPAREKRRGEWQRRLFLWSLLAIALWTPLPFGSARPWAAGALAIALGLLVMARGLADLARPEDEPIDSRMLRLPSALFGLVLAWAIIQSLPLVPAAWQHPLWAEVQPLLSLPTTATVGIDGSAARGALVHLLIDAAAFWLGFRVAQRPEGARALFQGVAAIGALYAGWGLFVYGSGNRTVLWFDKWAYPDDLTGTFINRNSFATFAGLALLTSLALLIDTVLARVDFQQSGRALLRSLADLLATNAAWLLAAMALTATAVMLTHSRGGALSTVSGVLGLLLVTFLAPSLRGPWRGGFTIAAAAGMMAILVISGATTLGRIADTVWDVE